jgi:hypothetical protein
MEDQSVFENQKLRLAHGTSVYTHGWCVGFVKYGDIKHMCDMSCSSWLLEAFLVGLLDGSKCMGFDQWGARGALDGTQYEWCETVDFLFDRVRDTWKFCQSFSCAFGSMDCSVESNTQGVILDPTIHLWLCDKLPWGASVSNAGTREERKRWVTKSDPKLGSSIVGLRENGWGPSKGHTQRRMGGTV